MAEEKNVELPCPQCKALHEVDIELKEIVFVRQYQSGSSSGSSGSSGGGGSTAEFVKVYQCPCCKTIYTQDTTEQDEKWRTKYRELLAEYKLNKY